MNQEIFSQLLQSCESDALDFKLTHYDLGQSGEDRSTKERKRASFAKDVLAFANLWRDVPRYIVMGVKRHLDGSVDLRGVTHHVDGADLVKALDGLVHPCPRIHYAQVEYQGLQFGVIEIPADRGIGPFFSTDNIGGGEGGVEKLLRKNALYCRRDSQNVEADAAEQQAIWRWFKPSEVALLSEFPKEDAWKRILDLSQLADSNCHHVLILALEETARDSSLANLAAVDWNLVVDLDPGSQVAGALKFCHQSISNRRSLHVVTPAGKLMNEGARTTSWYFANGLQVSDDVVPELTFKQWFSTYGKATAEKIEQVAAGYGGPTTVTVLCERVSLSGELVRIIEDFNLNFGARISCVCIASSEAGWTTLERNDMATVIPMTTRHFLDGLASYAMATEVGLENVVQLPGLGGVPKSLSREKLAYLEEDLELVHLSAGTRPLLGVEALHQFLRGGLITWFDLGLQSDVQREKTDDILRAVERDLLQHKSSRVNLYHEPGSGGSTIARRILWTLRQRYPSVVIRRCVARETAERLSFIYRLTGLPTLILREGGDVPETEADQLANLLAGRNVPSVLLQVLRRYQPPAEGQRSIFVRSQLSEAETERFRFALQTEAPERNRQIAELASGARINRTPFLFGLTAFESQFDGLRPFVKNHLAQIPLPQVKVLQFLALAYDYGQQALAASHFADLLQLSPTRPVDFDNVLCDEARNLLVMQGSNLWRPMHQLVSTEILELTLSSGSDDTRLWNTRLGDLAREFIDFCRTNRPVPPEDLQLALEQICVRRDDAELLKGTVAGENKFGRLVSDLPSSDARLLLFEHLVKMFPENPHFWAHLGRYHSVARKDFGQAEEAINHAIGLNGDDQVLHHMKGMALRDRAYQMILERDPLFEVVAIAKQASSSFEEASRLAPEEDYGYISQAQMMLRVIDYARSGGDAASVLSNETTDPWLREGLERVENLLSNVGSLRPGRTPTEYEERCRATLDVLYGAHDHALQRWDQLLQRKNPLGHPAVYAPPIRRQIVWLQLARCDRKWEGMSPKHLKRSLDLLEQNIQQEPNDDRNIRLWLQAARFQTPAPLLSVATDRVATWRSRGDSLDAVYYLYVLKVVEALEGSAIAADEARKNMEICKAKAGFRRDRSRSFEWLGQGVGLRRLVHQDQLGSWNEENRFWDNVKPLVRLEGVISKIHAPQAGEIELRWGLKAFFVPAASGIAYGNDENKRVSFYLGFSYDGLRAWAVSIA